jgi:MFS transporter, CP family, cyanate transporter
MQRIDSQKSLATATHGIWLMTAVVLVALNLRPSMAAIGPLLSAIRDDVSLSFGAASLLTMLPVMAMGAAMFFGMRVASWMGEHRAIMLSLIAIGVATLARLWLDSAVELILSAVLAGLGIAMIQGLMPVLIKSRFSHNVSLCMGLYVTSIMGGAALAASFAPLVSSRTGSWRAGLAIWAVLAVIGLLIWWTQKAATTSLRSTSGPDRESFVRVPRAWLLGLFFGLGTASYTCVLAWLAPYYVEQGWSEQNAGLVLGFLTSMEVLSGLIAPAIANRSRDRRAVIAVLLVLMLGGFLGLILVPQTLPLLWPCLLGLGIGGLFPMSLIVSMDHLEVPARAGGLTAFVQGIGYLIAGLSPLLAGLIRDATGSFEGAWWSLAGVVLLMLLIVLRFNPERYRHYLK